MAKKYKTDQQNGSSANGDGSVPSIAAVPSTPKKRAKSPKAPAAKPSPAKGAAKKTGAKPATKKPARRSGRKSSGYEPTDAEIRVRAYFIAERRAQLSLAGDPANDWLEARQQLVEEAGKGEAS